MSTVLKIDKSNKQHNIFYGYVNNCVVYTGVITPKNKIKTIFFGDFKLIFFALVAIL